MLLIANKNERKMNNINTDFEPGLFLVSGGGYWIANLKKK